MHRCSSSHGNMVGSSCSCSSGLYPSQSNSFSMLFSMPNHKSYDETDMYAFMSPSSVDCTLSLGTPSTRLSEDDEKRIRHDQRRSASNCMTDFCWDFLHTKNSPYNTAQQNHKTSRGGNNSSNTISSSSGNDPLLARRCANCDTTSTPLWRNGPRGPKVSIYIYNFFVLIYLFWLVCFTIESKFIFTVTMQCLWNSVQEGREKSHSSKCKQLKHRVSSGAATWLLQQFMGSSSTNAVAKNALFFSCKWV